MAVGSEDQLGARPNRAALLALGYKRRSQGSRDVAKRLPAAVGWWNVI